MNTRFYLLLLLFSAFATLAAAQRGQISGRVLNQDGPLAYATLLLKQLPDSTVANTALTDEAGRYTFRQIPPGNYFITASYVGTKAYWSEPITVTETPVERAPILLKPAATALAEVEVVAEKPLIEVKPDRTVFNVQQSLSAAGEDGFQLLRKAPGLLIDNNNNIILEGKAGVQIFIDGKLSPLAGEDLTNYLRSLDASTIEAIELITQPSSKYDAAGNAGIINIRLKRDQSLGTNGTFSTGYEYGRNGRYNGSLTLNNRTKKTSFFGNYSYRGGESWSFLYLDRLQNGVRYDAETESLSDRSSHNGRMGFDVFPGERHTVGVLLNGSLFNSRTNSFSQTPIIPVGDSEVQQTLIADNRNQNDNYNFNTNLNYRFADTSGYELTLDADYGRYRRDQNNLQPNRYVQGLDGPTLFEQNYRMATLTDIEIITAKADYSMPLLGGQFSAGAKYALIRTDNDFDFFNQDETTEQRNDSRSNRFLYTENINAAYLNYSHKWGKWDMQLGLRAEQTISDGDLRSAQSTPLDRVQRNYLNWFPSGGLTYSPSRGNTWALTYSRRIQRPNYQSLNPFENQLNELSFSRGNPFLQPQYTENIKLARTFNYRITASVSYSFVQDFFAQITDTLDSDRSFMIARNIANQQVWNVSLSSPVQIKEWWSAYVSINASRSSYEARDEKFQPIDQSTLSFYAQNTFTLPLGLKLQVSGWYSSPYVWSGTYQSRSLGSLDLGLQRKFMQDRLSVRLSANDVLFTNPWRADMRYGGLYIDGTGGWESRRIKLNVSYAFGSKQVKKARDRKTGLEEEQERIGN
jgi:iron complex outermembrane recepter protein